MIEDAEYAVLPGDPGRVEPLAKAFDPQAKFLSDNRGYTSYLANFHGQKVVVCSSGIGGPSISIAMEELAVMGIKNFLRVGTCGALQPHIKVGELVITRAAVRLDGASTHYAPLEYPAAASLRLTMDLVEAAEALKLPYHVGITASSDTFYPGQERYDNFTHYVPRRFQNSTEEWRKLNVANLEMESATLLTLANVFGLEAACVCGVVVNRTNSEQVDPDAKEILMTSWCQVAVDTIYRNMQRKGLIQ
jgi:uridine phosphorylase